MENNVYKQEIVKIILKTNVRYFQVYQVLEFASGTQLKKFAEIISVLKVKIN